MEISTRCAPNPSACDPLISSKEAPASAAVVPPACNWGPQSSCEKLAGVHSHIAEGRNNQSTADIPIAFLLETRVADILYSVPGTLLFSFPPLLHPLITYVLVPFLLYCLTDGRCPVKLHRENLKLQSKKKKTGQDLGSIRYLFCLIILPAIILLFPEECFPYWSPQRSSSDGSAIPVLISICSSTLFLPFPGRLLSNGRTDICVEYILQSVLQFWT